MAVREQALQACELSLVSPQSVQAQCDCLCDKPVPLGRPDCVPVVSRRRPTRSTGEQCCSGCVVGASHVPVQRSLDLFALRNIAAAAAASLRVSDSQQMVGRWRCFCESA